MGVVTLGAGLLDRDVGKLLVLECLGLIGMAFETDGIDCRPQQLGEIRLVHVVAGGAASDGNRPMDELALHDGPVMALEAEFRPGRAKLEFVGGLVGIMAGEAFPLFDRGVYVLVGIEPLVALGAQLARVINRCKRMLSRRLVAEGAVARCYGTMHIPLGAHFPMAIGGNAGRFRGG
jgi:hypothetical protein